MTTLTTARPPQPAGRPRRHRSTIVIAGLTTMLGLWLGLTAPSVSPVAPPPLAGVQDAAAAPVAGAPAAPVPAGATTVAPARGGGGRR